MADEPKNPQQIIDDATKALGQTTAPPPQPELLVIPPIDQKQESPPPVVKPPKKKGGKGMLIGILLFFILTLPVAIYYISQYQQLTEMRKRAAEGVYPFVQCCAKCSGYYKNYSDTTCPGASENACNINSTYCVPWHTITCPARVDCGSGPGNTPTPTEGSGACGGRTAEGTWHGCDYLNNTGSSGPVGSGCDSSNCGGQSCGCFTYKCGSYCLKDSCGADACYDNTPRPTATNTPAATNTSAPTATNTPGPTATVTPENTSAPGTCDASCDSDSNCESGLSCYSVTGVKRCRKAACPDRSNCECPIAESAATPTTRSVIAQTSIATATQLPTPKVPVSGAIDVKAIVITIASVLLLALGLIL